MSKYKKFSRFKIRNDANRKLSISSDPVARYDHLYFEVGGSSEDAYMFVTMYANQDNTMMLTPAQWRKIVTEVDAMLEDKGAN